jgi:uncharacterized phage-associated protein
MVARYLPHTAKALETILWIANAKPGIDIYHIVKTIYFADKKHFVEHGRPIFGEDYQAHRFGPLGSTAYGLLSGDPLEQLALGNNGPLPFKVGENWAVTADREANVRMLSRSDVSALASALDEVADLSFDDLVEITHDDVAYRAANGGRMKYEDMLDHDDPEYEFLVEDIRDSARHVAF